MSNPDFPSISKSAWLAQIQKDLKDKPIEALDWRVSEDLRVSPLVHGEDFPKPPAPLSAAPNNWQICEEIPAQDPVQANRIALDALEGGVEGLEFSLEGESAALETLLNDIYIDFIGLHFSGPLLAKGPGAVLSPLGKLAAQRQLDPAKLHGTLAYNPLALAEGFQPDWRYLGELVEYGKQQFPGFRMIQVDLRAKHEGNAAVLAELQAALEDANQCLTQLSKRGVAAQTVVDSLHFNFAIGTSYFLEMAKIRAFRLLWLNLLQAWKLPLHEPYIAVSFHPGAYSDELYSNMIRATTMSMSAVLGGAQRLTVLPYDAGREAQAQYPPAFSRRIARNVQHLLKMESFLDEIQDPAAGSYYIENLTRELAEKAWGEFCATK